MIWLKLPYDYVTHDHGHYRRLVHTLAQRCACADELQPALEVWTSVQSVPDPAWRC